MPDEVVESSVDGAKASTVFEDGQEYVVVGGDKIPVYRSETFSSESPKYTAEQRRKIGEVYVMVARQLPTEGRDYDMSFSFPDPDGNPKVAFRARTRIGADFIRHLANTLAG